MKVKWDDGQITDESWETLECLPNDSLAYIHWDEGKMADRDGFGCYKGSDLKNLTRIASKDYFPGEKKQREEREKHFQEKKKKYHVKEDKKEIDKKDKDDLGLSDKDAAPKWLQDLPTKLVDTLADPVLEMGKDPRMKEKEKQTINPEDDDIDRMDVNPQYKRLSSLDVEADGEGVGYGGNRPGIAVAPKNDENVSLNAQNEIELDVANLKWIAKHAPNVNGWAIFNTQPINFKGQEVPAGTQILVIKDNSERGLSKPELEQALFDNFGKDLARVSLKVDLAILKKGSEVRPVAYDAKRRELKFVAVENDQISGWTSVDKFDFQIKKAKEHKLVVKSLEDAQAICSAGDWTFSRTGSATRDEIDAEFKKHVSSKNKEAGTREISYEKCDCGHMKFDHDVEDDGTSKCDECDCKKFSKKASKKKAVKTTKCVKCDKSAPVEDMVKNVHGAGYLCKDHATEWNKDTEASVESLQKQLEGATVIDKVIRIKSIKILEELAEKCPECFEKFVKFAEQGGRTIKADDVEDVITNIREKIKTTKERLETTVEPIETEAKEVVAQDPNSPPADDPGPGYKWFWNDKTMAWEKMQENAGGGAAGAPPAGGFAGGTTY